MKLKQLLNDLAINFEMIIVTRLQKKYHSTRSRRKDITADYKVMCRTYAEMLDSEVEKAKLKAKENAVYYKLIDDLDDSQFYEYLRDFIKELKENADTDTLNALEIAESFIPPKPQEEAKGRTVSTGMIPYRG